ncbi:MAG TPA: pyridoxamine 5'-phosphate oxidase family protein [Burkholderiaceae bacterium]|nr:pyridoxamine 5'-phosphate oxidase family protein [Burkholderiaceae bacterium]
MAQSEKRYEDIVKTVEKIGIAMMTTHEDDGTLSSRPMAVMRVDDDGSVWFFTKDGTHKLEHLRHVNLGFADRDDADYVSMSGSGEVVRDRDTIRALWSPMAKPWFPDGVDDPTLVALRVRANSIEWWDSNSSRMLRLLGMAGAALTGTTYGNGDHGRMRPPH